MSDPLRAVLAVLLLAGLAAPAQAAKAPLAAARVDEQLGATVPRELPLRDAQGRAVRLGDRIGGGGPTLLVLGYYHCPMLCGQVLDATATALEDLEAQAPELVPRVVAVSIDPRDDAESATRRQRRVLSRLGWEPARWPFLFGEREAVHALAERVGFHYRRDPASGQYAHPAVLIVLTPDGSVSRYLYGIRFDPDELAAALRTAREGGTQATVSPVLLRCLQYVPALRRYADEIAWFLRGGAVLIVLALGAWLARMWRAELRRERT